MPKFETKNMPYRQLGPSGLRVPVFSLGGWLTLGGTVKGDPVKEIMQIALDNGGRTPSQDTAKLLMRI
jgi:aryl-alcohol dehydrogenase-like predicted oxidoreductase